MGAHRNCTGEAKPQMTKIIQDPTRVSMYRIQNNDPHQSSHSLTFRVKLGFIDAITRMAANCLVG